MRYTELNVETQRESPARTRSEGESLLRRAGYLDRHNEMTALGEKVVQRIHDLPGPAQEGLRLLGLPALVVDKEYFFSTPAGDVEILHCPDCGYGARRELAKSRKSPLPPEPLRPLEKIFTPDCNTIASLARFLEIPESKTAKAMMYTRNTDSRFVFVVIRGDTQLSERKLQNLAGSLRPATPEEIVASGAVPGFASPIGLRNLLIVVDDLIPATPNLVAGANEAGFHLKNTNYGRDYAAEVVADLMLPSPGDPCPDCGSALQRGDALVLVDANGYAERNVLLAIAEAQHDEKGLIFPASAAAFHVYLLNLPGKQLDTRARAEELYRNLTDAGISVLFDDRDERAGVKFTDADLIGLPVRVTCGEKGLRDGMVELKPRASNESQLIPFDKAASVIRSLTQIPQ